MRKCLNEFKIRNIGKMLLMLVLVIGIAVGGFFTDISPTPFLHQYFSPLFSGDTLAEVFRNTFVSLLLFLAAAFLAGLSAFGQISGILMLFYRGFGIGISTALMYAEYGAGALPSVLVLLLPKVLLSTGISVLAVREMIRSSGMLLKYVVNDGSQEHDRKFFRLYCLKFAVLVFLSFAAAVLDSLMNYLLAGFIS